MVTTKQEPITQRAFCNRLIKWYQEHQRSMPWRETQDPYKIWISEIILQQTQVIQGLAYYHRFIEAFPTVSDLATAPEQEVLKLWQGLGYYSRARNLHFAAQQVMRDFDGEFPKTHKEILALKGVGDYTAAAIGSFAFDLPYAVLDGNVYRLLSRIFGIETPIDTGAGKKEFSNLVQSLLFKKDPATFNNAIMDFGATLCTPKNPNCENCPFQNKCMAYQTNRIEILPLKKNKLKQKERHLNYFLILDDENNFYLEKRTSGIWKNLYQLPLIETATKMTKKKLMAQPELKALINHYAFETLPVFESVTHILSHQRLHANFCVIRVSKNL
ncbi:MAG: A/G-specific adenine glycosylase, partial [Lentisphaeria bacterium]|nr:A/G-specific adenine glycosylase [Lentisphaeria bacterium]